MKRILFQGDSITDCGRSREVLTDVGNGYPYLVRAHYGLEKPGQFEIVNRGISGNRSVDVYARIKADIINLKPDIMSMLIGVNDVWHEFGNKNGVEPERFEKVYRMLIEDTKAKLPNIKFMLMEPFVLPGRATEAAWEDFSGTVYQLAEIVQKLAKEYNLSFVPLQEKLNAACKLCPPEYWLGDGVHPTAAGHRLISDAWLEVFHKEIV